MLDSTSGTPISQLPALRSWVKLIALIALIVGTQADFANAVQFRGNGYGQQRYQQRYQQNYRQQPFYRPGYYQPPNYQRPQVQQPVVRPNPQRPRNRTNSAAAEKVLYVPTKKHASFPRLAADFEPQRALILSVSDLQPHHSYVLEQLVDKTRGHVEVVILCNDRNQLEMTLGWLDGAPDDFRHVRFAQLELNTIWLRDFAPHVAETSDGFQAIDFYYAGERPKDDKMPKVWASRTAGKLIEVPWTLQGGNLLCNGKHTAIASRRIFEDNHIRFPNPNPNLDVESERRRMVADAIIEGCNLEQLVLLEPLKSEATKHVDMFATFLAEDTIVVAGLDRRRDPVNAAILDRNARRLQAIKVDGRPLKVQRLQIPPRTGESWSAFTNIIIANDLVMMPIYKTDPPDLIRAAVQTYKRLLPNHQVETIDITTFKKLQGELHCLSMNLPRFAPLPKTISYEQADRFFKDQRAKRTVQQNGRPRQNVDAD